ncbi:hypothetical protein BJ912DRAFT_1044125 [Pholiota molesta]|nr:hypothetical protein BJ912DRAFT_1044125 [Pholiota molesta]
MIRTVSHLRPIDGRACQDGISLAETSALAVEAHRLRYSPFSYGCWHHSEAHQHHIGVDDTAGVTLGSGGQLQIGDDEGNLSQPSDPDSTSPDDHQQVPALDSPPPTLPITDSPLLLLVLPRNYRARHYKSTTLLGNRHRPPIPANLNVHPATFYVGISLGSLVAVALVTALMPGGSSENSEKTKGLESGRNASEMDDDTLAALNLGSREDLAHIQAWSSHRDRDVGEPKHAPTDPNTFLYGSNPYGRPRRTLYTDQGYGYPNTEYSSNPAPRHLPSHLIPDDISARAHQRENSLYTRNTVSSGMDRAYGDPRRTAAWQQESLPEGPLSRSMADRLRNVGKHRLMMTQTDYHRPPVQLSERKSLSSGKGDGSGISRRGSVATTASKPWTLEEIADGAGVVHLHLPEIEEHEHASQRPPLHRPTLSFGDGENISMDNNAKAGRQNFQSRDPQIELFASSKPKRAFIRPETYFARQKSTETVNAKSVSRASSIYSTQSAHSGALPRRGASRRSRLPLPKSNLPPRGHLDHEESDSVVIAPDTISRLSSTDSSLMMLSAEGSLLGPRSHTDAAASRALKERQKKVIEAQTAQSLSK